MESTGTSTRPTTVPNLKRGRDSTPTPRLVSPAAPTASTWWTTMPIIPRRPPPTTPVALDNATLDAIVAAVAPSWTEGSRNFLALYLAGWLLKSGVPIEDVRQVISVLAAQDEERPSRLQAVERTAARLQ